MTIPRALAAAATVALLATACATTVRVPEIPVLDGAFKAAVREPDPSRLSRSSR